MSHLSTHVLDTSRGVPASGIAVELADGGGSVVATGITDADGRVGELGPDALEPGLYLLTFATGAYFAALGATTFFPSVSVAFEIADAPHYHVPLLLSPFAYSTYRGS